MNLYDQLVQLQVMDSAFVEWKHYREELTDYLIAQMDAKGHVALFGAGRCNDLDLAKLALYMEEITLIDQDEQAMHEAVARYGLEKNKKIHILKMDFVGISPQMYRDYADTLIKEIRKDGMQTNLEVFANFVKGEIEKVFRERQATKTHLIGHYDYGVAIGVHSQLLNMLEWIWQMMLQTLQSDEVTVRAMIHGLNEQVVKGFNDGLIACINERLIVGCEKQRIGRAGGIEGAIQALDNFNRRHENKEIVLEDVEMLRWPFDSKQGVIYELEVQTINTRKRI